MEDDDSFSPPIGKLLKLILYILIVLFWINIYLFLELFFKIVFPNFGKSGIISFIKMIIILVVAICVGETLFRRNILMFLLFTISLLVINTYAIWQNWFAY